MILTYDQKYCFRKIYRLRPLLVVLYNLCFFLTDNFTYQTVSFCFTIAVYSQYNILYFDEILNFRCGCIITLTTVTAKELLAFVTSFFFFFYLFKTLLMKIRRRIYHSHKKIKLNYFHQIEDQPYFFSSFQNIVYTQLVQYTRM